MTLGERLKYAREAKGWTQKETADKAGISFRTYYNWEHELVEPNLFGITCVADVLGVSLDWLTGRE